MSRKYCSNEELQRKILQGVETLANNVATTLGPKGRNVILQEKGKRPIITKDGVTVAKFVEFDDHFMNAGAQIIKQAAEQTNSDAINGTDSNDAVQRPDFADLTPIYPDTKLRLERAEDSENTTSRAIDLVAPVGKGQRVLIVSNPRSGREEVIKEISQSIESNYSEVKLLVLLIDTPPEHVTEMRRWLTRSDVIASTFDQSPEEHVAIAELTIERAKRMVEMGEDVAVIIDGMTSLARAYNLISSNSGRQASSDVDASALYLPKRSFGAGRKVEEGGSLTVFASVLSGTSSKLDEMLLQELQGGSTSEIYLSQETAEAHIVPALDVAKSGTQNEEGLSSPEEHKQVQKLRSEIREAASKGTVTSGMELLLEKIVATEDNESLLETYS